jgi:4-amino-4-deoxy-L-arabinose transferase-like glycosyltransferase
MPQPRRARTINGPVIAILAIFASLCLAYSVTVPLGESPDELAHYRYVHYIDQVGRPPLTAEDRQLSGYKGHEPPLYYLLLHQATRPLRIAQQPMLKMLDPDRQPQHSIASEVMLWNAVLHTADEAFPWQGTSLAWHLMRFLFIPLGMVTILCTYSIVRQLAPAHPPLALLAAGLNAFTPQFVYISAVLNNDNLAVPLSVVSLWILVHVARGDLRWRWFVLLGVVVGLARITKFYTLILVPIIGIALLLIAWRLRRWRRCLLGGLLLMALILAVSAPWIMAVQPDDPASAPQGALGFVLKMLDILHTDRILRSQGMSASGGDGPSAWLAMILSFFRLEPRRWAELLFKSFWGYYGPMTIEAPAWFYMLMLALGLASLAGLGRTAWLAATKRQRGLLGAHTGLPLVILAVQAAAFLLLEALFYTIMRRLPDTAQGRHLYSAMPAWMLLLALGLAGWLPRQKSPTVRDEGPMMCLPGRGMVLILPGALCALSIYALPAVVLAPYEPALPVRTSLSASWQPSVAMGQESAPGLHLVGYGPAISRAAAGQPVTVRMVWQAQASVEAEYLLRIAAVDAQDRAYTLYLAQPLNGRWPTRAWDPGDYVLDEPTFTIPPGLAEGRYGLRCAWLNDAAEMTGVELDAGTLEVVPDSAFGAIAEGLNIEGASDGIVSYRQALVVSETGRNLQPKEVASTAPLIGSDGQAWLPVANQVFASREGASTMRRFYVVTGQVEPGRYQVASYQPIMDSMQEPPIPVEVQARARVFAMPRGYTPLQASLGEHIELLGYRIEGATWPGEAHPTLGQHYAALRPGQTLNLLLAWRATGWVPRSYTVFTHLLDERKIVRAQHDQVPRFNYATMFWVPGEVVTDLYSLTLPSDAPVGIYEIELGMYERRNGERLAIRYPDGTTDTRVALPPILVSSANLASAGSEITR